MKAGQNKRLKYIDIARGFAMLIIVLSHTISAVTAHSYEIYRFLFFINVPIFFVLSGYLFQIKKNESFFCFLKNKFLRIMLPYFLWALIFLIPYLIFGRDIIDQFSQESSFDVWQQIGNVFYGNGTNNALKQNGPLWFLPALFTTEILYYFIIYFVKNKKTEILTLVIVLIVGFLCSFFTDKVFLPWGINSALTIGVFFYFGYLLKKWRFLDKLSLKASILWLIGWCIICVIAMCLNEPNNVVWADYQYRNYFLTILIGITSSLIIIQLAKYIDKNRVLEYVGVNTMSILIFHKIIIVVAQTKLGGFSRMLMDSNMVIELLLSLVVMVVATIFSIFVGWLLRKACPFTIGEYKKSKRNLA